MSVLPERLTAADSEAERDRWRIVKLDDFSGIDGRIVEADITAGKAKMWVRGPDEVDKEGNRKQTWHEVVYDLGPGSIAIVMR